MRDITKSFPGVKALDGVNLKVEKGTVHALMGENGAGKSTLMKILFGQQPPDSGTILFNGQEVHFKSVKEAVNAGISMIYQELSPIKELSIAENVFVGRYPKTRAGAIDWKTMYDSCQKIFDRWGLNYNPRTKIKMLKTADIQQTQGIVESMKALGLDATNFTLVGIGASTSQWITDGVEYADLYQDAQVEAKAALDMMRHMVDGTTDELEFLDGAPCKNFVSVPMTTVNADNADQFTEEALAAK